MATSYLLTDMASEIAKSIGGAGTQANVDLATIALKAAVEDWNAAKEWNYLLRDTSTGYSVSGCTATAASADVTSPTTGAFDFVNPGSTVTISTGSATLAAGTTVLSITRNSTGVVSSITLSNAFGGTTNASAMLSFTGDIVTTIGVNEYNLPPDFNSAYAARTFTNKRLLEYIKYREWNKKVVNQDINGTIEAYTIWNPISPLTQNFRTYRMRVFRTPSISETIHLQYFRRMNPNNTTVDIPDNYVYFLMDMGIYRFITLKNTEDTRIGVLEQKAVSSLKKAMIDDDENSDDETFRLISQMESWSGERMLWTNGNFYPTIMDY